MGKTTYILETGFSAIGNITNFIGLSALDGSKEKHHFPKMDDYYWAIGWYGVLQLFLLEKSVRRTIKNTIQEDMDGV
ncbi:MAG: hypothetical protein ACLR43_02005 [Faecalibacillus faecis]